MTVLESSDFDEFLDRRLSGEDFDVSEFLQAHPELTEDERRRIGVLSPRLPRTPDVPTEPERGQTTDSPASPFPQIDGYRLKSRLGAGGMGAVFLADDLKLGREVAIKILGPDFLGTGEHAERFLREVRAVARLRHPNIVVMHAAGEQGDVRFMVMEHVPGSSYQDGMADAAARGSRVPIKAVLSHGIEIARALQCAHEAGIIHRDVKPSNIRITPEGHAVLLDFGLVREVGDTTLTLAGDFRGSPHYASPEQVRSDHAGIDARTDVYSLSATLYEALTGVAPFRGETREQLFHSILARDPLPLRRFNPLIPRDLQTVVLTSLEKEPGHRHPTAAAFASDLEAIRDGRPVSVRPISVFGRLFRWARRQPGKAALGAALLVAIPLILVLGDFMVSNLPKIAQAAAADKATRLSDLLEDAYLEYGEGDPKIAQALFEESMRSYPESFAAKAGFALCRIHQGDRASVLSLLDGLPEPHKSSYWADRLRVQCLPRDDPDGKSITARLKPPSNAFDHFITGTLHLQRVHREFKNLDKGYSMHAPQRTRDAEDAFHHLQQAVLSTRVANRLYYFELGHAAWHAGMHQEARGIAAAIVELWPESPERWFAVGRTLLGADYNAALDSLEKAANPRPRSVTARRLILSILAESGRGGAVSELAVTIGTELVALDPSDLRSHRALGVALLHAGNADASIAELETAVSMEPDYASTHHMLSHAYLLKKDHESSIRSGRESIRLDPKYHGSWNTLGTALVRNGEVDEAIKCFESALEFAPDPSVTLWNLGLGLQVRGDFVRALDCLRRAHESGSKQASWPRSSKERIAEAERQAALENRLIEIRRGEGPPSPPKELRRLAREVCRPKRLFAEAAGLFAQAFEQDPNLKSEREPYFLRFAVTSALQAGLQLGGDSPKDEGERAKLREQARAWFEEELNSFEKTIAMNPKRKESVSKFLNTWKSDRKLIELSLGANPSLTSEETAAWRLLWQRCDRLLATE